MADTDESGSDICRVCRMEGTSDRPLYHPCICTGSIKYIHQECLTQWLKYSKKEYCELCNYKYTFMPIYHPDMPKRLPVNDLVFGLFKNLGRALSYWLHYTAVAIAWLGIVPLTACRIYRCLFTGSLNSILSLPLDMLSTENLMFDCLQGFFILAVTLCTFISLIWLREQIVQGDMAQWVNNNDPPAAQPADAGGGGGGAGAQNPGQAVADEGGDSEGEEDGLLVNNAGDLANNANVNAGVAAQEHHNAEAVGPEDENVIAPAAVAEPAPLENDDANWQPFEWNQAADELTWERLLGLDGSLVFLEHVFWVISLNTLFILVFGFSPYHIGHFVVIACNLLPHVSATYFEGVVTILIGYFVIAAALFVTHKLLRLFSMSKTSKFLGMCYLVIKVFLLVVMEIGIFPVLCGFWLDVCSLSLFNSTMKDRVDSYHGSPGTSLFIHWLVGMVYVFYFASFVLLLREVLRPGVLWFLRNLNDPDFNPIKEMIQFPVYRHLRRFGASLAMFGVTIILIVFVPIQLIFKFCPKVLPYNISLSVEAPLSELSLELLLLQVVLPALLEQGHARQALKTVARRWCFVVGRALDLLEYLLPAEDLQRRDRNHNVILNVNDVANNGQAQQQAAQAQAGNNLAIVAHAPNNAAVHLADRLNNLAAEHQAILGMAAGPGGEQAYRRSSWFPLRICALLIVLSLSFLMASLLCLTVPVSIGREVIALFLGRTPIHELYTMACGLYLSWVVLRVWVAAVEWLPEGWDAVCTTLRNWACVAAKFASVGVALAGVLPLALGLLFQLVVITPMRVSTNQSPIFFLWQDWAMGILHCKIVCAIVMMGPDWWLKQVFERIYLDGLRNMNVGYIYSQLIVPVMLIVGLVITVPYAVARTIVPALGTDMETQVQFQRHVYPCLLVLTMIVAFLWWQTVQFMRLIQHIRNDKYLVGQRLVNYERSREVALNSEASRTTTAQEDEASNLAEMPEVEGAEEIHNVQQIMAEA